MQTQVKIPDNFKVVGGYKWRDRHGVFHEVDSMETKHLFHVVRMVWDHSMPKEHQTSFLQRYRFPGFYTEQYMALTVRLMLPALFYRQDLEPEMAYWIQFMHDKIKGVPPQIPFIRMISNV